MSQHSGKIDVFVQLCVILLFYVLKKGYFHIIFYYTDINMHPSHHQYIRMRWLGCLKLQILSSWIHAFNSSSDYWNRNIKILSKRHFHFSYMTSYFLYHKLSWSLPRLRLGVKMVRWLWKFRGSGTSIGIPIIKTGWSHDSLIFIMEIPVLGKTTFIIRQGHGSFASSALCG